jgi:hypothetical protein
MLDCPRPRISPTQSAADARPQLDLNVLEDRTTPTVSAITGNFNGTAIPAGDTLWFSSVAKIQNMPASGTTLDVTNQTISFTAGGVSYSLHVPDSTITLAPGTTDTTLTTDGSGNWIVDSPTNFPGNVFLSGAELALPSGLPGGVKNVTWSADFTTTTPGVKVNWQWAAAAYTQFGATDASLNVKPTDGKTVADPNSDHAGTPEAFKQFVTGGATGGGGSNWTGSLSATVAVTPGPIVTQSPSSLSGFVVDQNGVGQVVLVTLTGKTSQGQSVTLTTTTDMTGFYSFANLQPGTYTVTEQPPLTENFDTYSGTQSTAGQIDGFGNFGTANGVTIANVTLAAGDVGTQYDFINFYTPGG